MLYVYLKLLLRNPSLLKINKVTHHKIFFYVRNMCIVFSYLFKRSNNHILLGRSIKSFLVLKYQIRQWVTQLVKL